MGFMNALKKPVQSIGKAVGKMAPPGMNKMMPPGLGPSPQMTPPPPNQMGQMAQGLGGVAGQMMRPQLEPKPMPPELGQGADMGQMTDQMAQPAMPPPQMNPQMNPMQQMAGKVGGLAPRPSFMGKLASKLKPRF